MNQPDVKFIDDMHVELRHNFTIEGITVPKGYITDGASTPWFVWLFGWTHFEGATLPAAVVHDYLCSTDRVPRWYADREFLSLLLRNNVGIIKCAVYYVGVRLGAFGTIIKNLFK